MFLNPSHFIFNLSHALSPSLSPQPLCAWMKTLPIQTCSSQGLYLRWEMVRSPSRCLTMLSALTACWGSSAPQASAQAPTPGRWRWAASAPGPLEWHKRAWPERVWIPSARRRGFGQWACPMRMTTVPALLKWARLSRWGAVQREFSSAWTVTLMFCPSTMQTTCPSSIPLSRWQREHFTPTSRRVWILMGPSQSAQKGWLCQEPQPSKSFNNWKHFSPFSFKICVQIYRAPEVFGHQDLRKFCQVKLLNCAHV